MSDLYSDESPIDTRAYWVRDRTSGKQTPAVLLLGRSGKPYWALYTEHDWLSPGEFAEVYQFGPAIPTADELDELREKAAIADVILNGLGKVVSSIGGGYVAVAGGPVCEGNTRLEAFRAAMAASVTSDQSPYGLPHDAGKDGAQ